MVTIRIAMLRAVANSISLVSMKSDTEVNATKKVADKNRIATSKAT